MKAQRVQPISDRAVLVYAGVLLILVVAAQTVTVMRGHAIDVVSALALVPAAAWFALFTARYRAAIAMRAYGWLGIHVIAYVLVVGSYWVHAGWLAGRGDSNLLEQGWSGPLIAMSAFWGMALIAHTIRSIYTKGFDDVEPT